MGTNPHKEVKRQGAVDFVGKMKKVHEEAGAALSLMQETMKKYYDRSRQPAHEYQVGDKVWLEATNINADRPVKKLDDKQLGLRLSLKCRMLLEPMTVELTMPDTNTKQTLQLSKYVKHQLYDPVGNWTSKTVRAIITPSLCAPVILGLPFLAHNNIVIDHALCTAVDKCSGFDLLHPTPPPVPKPPCRKLKQFNSKTLKRIRNC
jgi:hypothetical protein